MSYVTLQEAKNLKRTLKESYKEIFKVKKLTKEEEDWYDSYKTDEDFFGEKKPNKEERKMLKHINRKLNGVKLNPEIKKEALDVFKKAFTIHEKHDVPKWYQLKKLYAYWQEKKAIASFEKMLMKKGVQENDIFEVKHEAFVKMDQERYLSRNNDLETIFKVKADVLDEEKVVINEDFALKDNQVYLKNVELATA